MADVSRADATKTGVIVYLSLSLSLLHIFPAVCSVFPAALAAYPLVLSFDQSLGSAPVYFLSLVL